jgi:hypothetical protein
MPTVCWKKIPFASIFKGEGTCFLGCTLLPCVVILGPGTIPWLPATCLQQKVLF